MGNATVAFTDLGRFSESSLPNVDAPEDQQLCMEPQISSDNCFEDILGKSSALQRALEQVTIVAPTDSTILLHGEAGTGKELIARAIHKLSRRRQCNFVRMNCAGIPSRQQESELFGHEKGAFTGAQKQRKGRFELADQGSLFLDEIADISLELQPKLSRAVEEQEFERLGGIRTIQVDVRIIAATHRDLLDMIRERKFREDLFCRLNVFPIHVPPLRERREDLPLLVYHFVSVFSRKMEKTICTIPEHVMNAIARCPWPGNIPELKKFIERSVILSRGDVLAAPLSELATDCPAALPQENTLHHMERKIILRALRSADGKVAGRGGAAEMLGLKRGTLLSKMQRLGIEKADYALSGTRQKSFTQTKKQGIGAAAAD